MEQMNHGNMGGDDMMSPMAPDGSTSAEGHSMDMSHGSMDMSSSGGHMMMKMYFHGGFDEVILFDFWRISSVGGLVGSMAIVFILSIGYEGLKAARDGLYSRHMINTAGGGDAGADASAAPAEEEEQVNSYTF
jgi:copper transporter 1